MLLLLAPLASADLITQGSGLDASLLYYQPVPAQPGDLVTVYVQVLNTGGSISKPGTIEFVNSGPFRLESESDRVVSFPGIPGQSSFLVSTQVRVAKDADEGENRLKVIVKEQGSQNFIERDLTISITGIRSSLTINAVTTEPQEILPGETSTINLKIQNTGATEVRNVDLALDLSEVNFAPAGNSNSRTIGTLSGGEERTVNFQLTSYPETPAQVYQIPFTIEYDDETGTERTQEEIIGLTVGAKPELLVYFDELGLTKKNPEGEAIIRFVNKGLSEIKLLEMTILENENVEVLSESPTIYIGNINNDDYESATLQLRAQEDVTVATTYKDALNREHTQEFTLPLTLKEPADEGQPIIFWVVVLGLATAGFWWWRKKKTSKNV